MLFSSSKIVNLSPETGAELLNNGTVRLLVMLRSSHLLHQPVNRNRKEMVEEYMKKAILKMNISKVLKDIVNCQNELKPEIDTMIEPLSNPALKEKSPLYNEITLFNHLSIFNVLDNVWNRIHRLYQQCFKSYKISKSSKKLDDKPYNSFTKFCYRYLRTINGFEYLQYREIFEQLGGYYVLLEMFQVLHIFYTTDKDSDKDGDCEKLLFLTVKLLKQLLSFKSSKSLCRQLARSPFHITMFFNLLRENRTNETFVRSTTKLLSHVFSGTGDINNGTLQSCRAIPCLAEIMMQENDYQEPEDIQSCVIRLFNSIMAGNQLLCDEFNRIDGAMAYLINKIANDYSGLIDGSLPLDNFRSFPHFWNKWFLLRLLQVITAQVFLDYPNVQDLCWKTDLSTTLVGLVKLANSIQYPDNSFYNLSRTKLNLEGLVTALIDSAVENLLYMIEDSEREKTKVRELIDIEALKKISMTSSSFSCSWGCAEGILKLLENE